MSAEATALAYAHCEAVTRRQAANFFYGIRLLARQQRRAMCAVYAFARRVDDIGDGTLEAVEKLTLLDGQARALGLLSEGLLEDAGGPDLVMLALADARLRFPLPVDALEDLIEGVRMDLAGVEYESFEELVLYCRRVAGAIGRVCLAIFGLQQGHGDLAGAQAMADDLGVALQLTNILRDVREDAENGRVYLPAEDLDRFGLIGAEHSRPAAELLAALRGIDARGPDAETARALTALVRFQAARADEWFARGAGLTPLLDRRSAACVLAMAGIYKRLLERIAACPEEVALRRVSLSRGEKAWVAMRGMLGVGA